MRNTSLAALGAVATVIFLTGCGKAEIEQLTKENSSLRTSLEQTEQTLRDTESQVQGLKPRRRCRLTTSSWPVRWTSSKRLNPSATS